MVEALACHPLGQSCGTLASNTKLTDPDTIKVRMQLSRRKRAPGVRPSTDCQAVDVLMRSRQKHEDFTQRERRL